MIATLALVMSSIWPDVALYNATQEMWSRAIFNADVRCVEDSSSIVDLCWTQTDDVFYVMLCSKTEISYCRVSQHKLKKQ